MHHSSRGKIRTEEDDERLGYKPLTFFQWVGLLYLSPIFFLASSDAFWKRAAAACCTANNCLFLALFLDVSTGVTSGWNVRFDAVLYYVSNRNKHKASVDPKLWASSRFRSGPEPCASVWFETRMANEYYNKWVSSVALDWPALFSLKQNRPWWPIQRAGLRIIASNMSMAMVV